MSKKDPTYKIRFTKSEFTVLKQLLKDIPSGPRQIRQRKGAITYIEEFYDNELVFTNTVKLAPRRRRLSITDFAPLGQPHHQLGHPEVMHRVEEANPVVMEELVVEAEIHAEPNLVEQVEEVETHTQPNPVEQVAEVEIRAEPNLMEQVAEEEIHAEPNLEEQVAEAEIRAEPNLMEQVAEEEIHAEPNLVEQVAEEEIHAEPNLEEQVAEAEMHAEPNLVEQVAEEEIHAEPNQFVMLQQGPPILATHIRPSRSRKLPCKLHDYVLGEMKNRQMMSSDLEQRAEEVCNEVPLHTNFEKRGEVNRICRKRKLPSKLEGYLLF